MATGNALNIQGCLRGGEAWDYLSRWSSYADCSETMNCNFQSCECWGLGRKVDQTHLRHVGQFSFTCRTISIHSRAVMAAVDHFSTCYKAPLQHTLSVNILLGLEASLVIPKMCVCLPPCFWISPPTTFLIPGDNTWHPNQTPLPKQDTWVRLTSIGI